MFQKSRFNFRQSGSALALVLALTTASLSQARADTPTYTFNIPAEDTATALNDFSRQAEIQIMFPYELAAGHQAPAIVGQFSRKDALSRLIAGTNLELGEMTATSITLRAKAPVSRVAATDLSTEVVVTGTHIRNANPTSPVHVVTRADIERSGYSQIGDVMRSLPEDFGGGQNPGVVSASSGNIANQNLTNASTVNLRGVGTDATLVLINGHRMNADSAFQGVDISGIPLGAVQRIEVVTDGASALYGSDAVAGVVNILLRKDLNGGEVKARVGTATQGGGTEETYDVLDGVSGSRSRFLANLEYSRQDPVLAGERGFTAGMDPTYRLLRFQERRSLFLTGGYDLSDRISVSVDGLIDDRRAVGGYTLGKSLYDSPVYTPAYNLATTVDAALPGDWKLKVTGDAAGSRNSYWTRNRTAGTATHTQYKNWTQYAEFTADGTLFNMPGGAVKGAFGGGYRTEGFQQSTVGNKAYYTADRNVSYVYGEVLAPLVAPSTSRPGLNELELSVSARGEKYNDLGSSTSPRLGLRYVPVDGLTLRSTWGKSFKAPSLIQMYSATSASLYNATDLGGTGTGTVLLVYGGNPNLKPERSTSWTVGADYKLPWAHSASVSVSYYHIDYTDRVVQPIANLVQGLSNPLYSPFVQYAPPAATQSAAIATANPFTNNSSGAYDPSKVVALLEDQYLNATSQTAHGVDVSYRQSFDVGKGDVSTYANATWIKLNQQTIITAPNAELSGTLFNVPDFKGRAGATWSAGTYSVTGIVNYISGQLDTGTSPKVRLASATTVDANASYQFAKGSGWSKGLKMALSVSNLFDKDPPRTISPISLTTPHFDSTNESILGRFVSLTISRDW